MLNLLKMAKHFTSKNPRMISIRGLFFCNRKEVTVLLTTFGKCNRFAKLCVVMWKLVTAVDVRIHSFFWFQKWQYNKNKVGKFIDVMTVVIVLFL